MTSANILNIAAYQFISLPSDSLPEWRERLKAKALSCSLKGTILLSTEGINLSMAGSAENITNFQQFLAEWEALNPLSYRETWSDEQPFQRLRVRIKKEIISMGKLEIQPEKKTAPYIEPDTFQQWYEQGRDMMVLDTRNTYEVELGTFKGAVDLNIRHFRHFPDAITKLPESAKDKPMVTFCTGGIRCEKAALWLLENGFKEVYQLKGGILNYFEQCGQGKYQGECFVFDERVTVDGRG